MTKPLGPYTPVVRAGDWIICSGQLGLAHGELVEGGIHQQTRQAIANIAQLLLSEGAGLGHVVKTMCFLAEMSDFAEFNAAYVEGFGDHRPARSTVAVKELPAKGALVEIEAWAYHPGAQRPLPIA
jgi:2-iminobutanoate/2-iminopropanoate deaminase